MFHLVVALVQITTGTASRFHLEIQEHLVAEGTPARPSQLGRVGALGQNNTIA